jgi:hypothetical protein
LTRKSRRTTIIIRETRIRMTMIQRQGLLLRVVSIKKKRRTHNATVVARRDTIQTNVLKKEKTQGPMGSEEGNVMHAQAESEKEFDDKEDDDNASQALQKSNKSETISKWSGLIVRKESLHNNGKQWATGTKGNSILLDNRSTLSLFGNPNMVKNIRESKTTLKLATNTGTKTMKQIADVPGFGMVW